MRADVAAVWAVLAGFLVIWVKWDEQLMGVVVPFLAALALLLALGLSGLIYVELRYRYARRVLEIERYAEVQYEHTGTYAEGMPTIDLSKVFGPPDLGKLPEAELLRALARIKDTSGRPRYSQTALSGLLRGSKQDRLYELREIMDEE